MEKLYLTTKELIILQETIRRRKKEIKNLIEAAGPHYCTYFQAQLEELNAINKKINPLLCMSEEDD